MSKTIRAFMHHFDDHGRKTKPAERTFAILAVNENPQVLDIQIRDKRTTRFRCIRITRAELERALKENPRPDYSLTDPSTMPFEDRE